MRKIDAKQHVDKLLQLAAGQPLLLAPGETEQIALSLVDSKGRYYLIKKFGQINNQKTQEQLLVMLRDIQNAYELRARELKRRGTTGRYVAGICGAVAGGAIIALTGPFSLPILTVAIGASIGTGFSAGIDIFSTSSAEECSIVAEKVSALINKLDP